MTILRTNYSIITIFSDVGNFSILLTKENIEQWLKLTLKLTCSCDFYGKKQSTANISFKNC